MVHPLVLGQLKLEHDPLKDDIFIVFLFCRQSIILVARYIPTKLYMKKVKKKSVENKTKASCNWLSLTMLRDVIPPCGK